MDCIYIACFNLLATQSALQQKTFPHTFWQTDGVVSSLICVPGSGFDFSSLADVEKAWYHPFKVCTKELRDTVDVSVHQKGMYSLSHKFKLNSLLDSKPRTESWDIDIIHFLIKKN